MVGGVRLLTYGVGGDFSISRSPILMKFGTVNCDQLRNGKVLVL